MEAVTTADPLDELVSTIPRGGERSDMDERLRDEPVAELIVRERTVPGLAEVMWAQARNVGRGEGARACRNARGRRHEEADQMSRQVSHSRGTRWGPPDWLLLLALLALVAVVGWIEGTVPVELR